MTLTFSPILLLRFLSNLLLIYTPIHLHIDPGVILPSIYTTFSFTISTSASLIARSPLPPTLTLFHYLYRSFKPKINKIPLPLSYNYQSPPFSPIRNLPESTELENRVNRLTSPGGNSSPQTHTVGMSRLAAMCSPSGGFWKISRN